MELSSSTTVVKMSQVYYCIHEALLLAVQQYSDMKHELESFLFFDSIRSGGARGNPLMYERKPSTELPVHFLLRVYSKHRVHIYFRVLRVLECWRIYYEY